MANAALILHSVLGYLATALLMAGLTLCAWITRPFARDPHDHFHRWARIWGKAVAAAIRVKIELEDREALEHAFANRPMVIAANHQSILDIIVLLATLPDYFAFVSKIEIFSVPLMGKYMEWFGCIRLKRGDRPGSREALANAIHALEHDRSILMFPEGTRSEDGVLGPFKRGAVMLAARTGRPVLPVRIEGTFNLLPKSTWLARPGMVTVRVGAPVSFDHVDPDDADAVQAATDQLRVAMCSLGGSVPRSMPIGEPAKA